MDTLRWVLLIIGGVFLFAIYWFGRDAEQRKQSSRSLQADLEYDDDLPVLTVPPDESFDPHAAAGELRGSLDAELESLEELLREEAAGKPGNGSQFAGEPEQEPVPQPDKVVVVYVVARPPRMFTRDALLQVFAALELEFGAMQIFHRSVEDGTQQQILFSVANLVKPGTLDIKEMPDFKCPGVSIFMQLPGPLNGLLAFDTMMSCAKELAGRLDGKLLDETRSTLTEQTIDHLRDEIKHYKLRKYRSGQRQLV